MKDHRRGSSSLKISLLADNRGTLEEICINAVALPKRRGGVGGLEKENEWTVGFRRWRGKTKARNKGRGMGGKVCADDTAEEEWRRGRERRGRVESRCGLAAKLQSLECIVAQRFDTLPFTVSSTPSKNFVYPSFSLSRSLARKQEGGYTRPGYAYRNAYKDVLI